MLTEAELTLLGLVAESPRFGREIEVAIDERGLREWLTVGSSSIYYLLDRLAGQALIVCRAAPKGDLTANAYEITEAGRGVLQTAVADLLRHPPVMGAGFELGLANLAVLRPRQVYLALTHHYADAEAQLEAVSAVWERMKRDEQVSDYRRALYTHHLALLQARLNWLSNFLDDWRERYPAVDDSTPGETDAHRAPTQIRNLTPPRPAKQLQQLKRPKRGQDGV